MNRKTQGRASRQQRAREQQAVLNQLRAGQGISGARPANPLIGALQNLTGVGAGAVPTLYGAELGGQEVLLGKGGWNKTTAATGPINVGGQTWYPAQSGQDLVYKRAPGNVGGQYGSIFSADQLASPAPGPGSQPPAPNPSSAQPPVKLSPEEQAYNAERSRIAQLTAQNPEFQNVGQLRNDLRDKGMEIWAAKYGNLAKQVKPGQSCYKAIQVTLNAGSMGAPMEIAFDTSNVLGGKPMPQGLSYGTSTPTQIPGGTPIQGGGFPKDKAAMFERFMQGPAANTPTFQGSPLGNATPVGQLNYGGAVQPLGNAISDDFYKTDEARKLAALFAQSGGMR